MRRIGLAVVLVLGLLLEPYAVSGQQPGKVFRVGYLTVPSRETRTKPIVMFLAIDPVASGLVASLARPGGNITGLTVTAGREIYGKQLQLLKDAFPRISRVAILINAGSPSDTRAAREREIEIAARALGLQWQMVGIRDPDEFDNVFAAMKAAHCDALFVPVDGLFYQHRIRLASLAAKSRFPAMWGHREHAAAGGLMSYGTDLDDLARRAATNVDKILKGVKPADLPVLEIRELAAGK
jgi:ABC-type uncharacterized transport system substrate-binding protein